MKPDCERCGQAHPRCNAHNTRGLPCMAQAKKDMTVCRVHGGALPQVIAAAERRRAEREAQMALETMGKPRAIDPHGALLEELHRTAGAVEWLGAVVAELEKEEITWGLMEEVIGGPMAGSKYGSGANVWVNMWQAERTQLVKVSKMCIDAGIEERKVRLAESAGELMAQVVRAILDELELSPAQREIASTAVPRQFRRLAAAA